MKIQIHHQVLPLHAHSQAEALAASAAELSHALAATTDTFGSFPQYRAYAESLNLQTVSSLWSIYSSVRRELYVSPFHSRILTAGLKKYQHRFGRWGCSETVLIRKDHVLES